MLTNRIKYIGFPAGEKFVGLCLTEGKLHFDPVLSHSDPAPTDSTAWGVQGNPALALVALQCLPGEGSQGKGEHLLYALLDWISSPLVPGVSRGPGVPFRAIAQRCKAVAQP